MRRLLEGREPALDGLRGLSCWTAVPTIAVQGKTAITSKAKGQRPTGGLLSRGTATPHATSNYQRPERCHTRRAKA